MKDITFSELMLDSLENGQIIIDTDFNVYTWNRWLSINTQISKEQIIGKNLKDFYPQINYTILTRRIKTALILNSPSFYDSHSKNSHLLPMKREKISGSELKLMQQQVTISPYKKSENLVMISIYDMSELFETKNFLQEEIQKVNILNIQLHEEQAIIDQNIMILRASADGKILDASTLLCETFGYEKSYLRGKDIRFLTQKKMPETTVNEIFSTISQKKNWYGEVENTMADGESKWTQVRITPILDNSNEISSYNIVYHDITNKKLLEELYITDPLTQIYNRRYFDSLMNVVSTYQRKEDTDFILIMADIDHFKSINDTYGHQIGDEAIKLFAKVLKNSLRPKDIVARWGGEEFIIMLKHIDVESAQKIAEKLRATIEQSPITDTLKMTSSFGLTKYRVGENILESFKRVDDALYEAKKSGRNKVTTLL